MTWLSRLSDGVTVIVGGAAVLAFIWRVLYRLSQIVLLLRELVGLKHAVQDHELRLSRVERLTMIERTT